eukprot:g29342.t1
MLCCQSFGSNTHETKSFEGIEYDMTRKCLKSLLLFIFLPKWVAATAGIFWQAVAPDYCGRGGCAAGRHIPLSKEAAPTPRMTEHPPVWVCDLCGKDIRGDGRGDGYVFYLEHVRLLHPGIYREQYTPPPWA